MKLEYPCRVEGWLNVCGEYTHDVFTCPLRVMNAGGQCGRAKLCIGIPTRQLAGLFFRLFA